MDWFEGIPTAQAVLDHESEHPRPDGIRLGRISTDDTAGSCYVKTNDWSYGEWICHHYKSKLEPYVSVLRLKTVNSEVFMAVGFCCWCKLSACNWSAECRYFPVGQNGLPKLET